MSSEETLDALIKKVASVHGIALSQDDPILMMHTLNVALLEQNEKAHAELLSNYQSLLEESFSKWCEYSADKSNANINLLAAVLVLVSVVLVFVILG